MDIFGNSLTITCRDGSPDVKSQSCEIDVRNAVKIVNGSLFRQVSACAGL